MGKNFLLIMLMSSPLLIGLQDFSSLIKQCCGESRRGRVAVAIVRGQEVDCQGAQANARYRIGSCTKAFVSHVIVELAREGRLDLDLPITTYLPELRLSDSRRLEQITLRAALSHQTGLARCDELWLGCNLTRAELLDRLADVPFESDFSTFTYSNLMYMIIAEVIERVTGNSWETEVETRIILPLGLRNTSIPKHEAGAAGAITSTASDLALWTAYQLQRPSITHNPIVAVDCERQYGLGWFVSNYRGWRMIHHAGQVDRYSAQILLLPELELGLVVLRDQPDAAATEAIALAILQRELDNKGSLHRSTEAS